MKKYLIMPLVLCFMILLVIPSFGHGGGIDATGGHHDYNNVSGLGSYHYHCDGHPAHLHTDGICPFSSSGNYNMSISEKLEKEMETNGLIQGPAEPIIIHSPAPASTEPQDSLFQSKDVIACVLFVVAYVAALLYRIFISKELYYFPFALSILSLVAMFVCLFLKEPALYVAGIAAIINLFCEK